MLKKNCINTVIMMIIIIIIIIIIIMANPAVEQCKHIEFDVL